MARRGGSEAATYHSAHHSLCRRPEAGAAVAVRVKQQADFADPWFSGFRTGLKTNGRERSGAPHW